MTAPDEMGREHREPASVNEILVKSMRGPDLVTGDSDVSGRPVARISSGTRVGGSDDRTSSQGVRLSAECSTATVSGGEDEALDLEGADDEGSCMTKCNVPAEASMPPCVARVLSGLGEVAGTKQLSVVFWSTG